MRYPLILPDIKPVIARDTSYRFYRQAEFDELVTLKNEINAETDEITIWDRAKKLTNPYELIYSPSKHIKIESVANINPLSRSYFKLWEILHKFSVYTDIHTLIRQPYLKIAHIAEGPGGFMEAIIDFRHKLNYYDDTIYGITLYSSNKNIPGWKKSQTILKDNPNINIIYGKDGTGNIYHVNNILDFQNTIGKGQADIITADGGFDFSIDFNKQEELALRLIFCEIVSALSVQKIGGMFICKFFDIYTHFSIKLLYMLKCVYQRVNIYKPLTSRPANSEKYIICSNFKGIDVVYLNQLLNMVAIWQQLKHGDQIIDVFDEIPYEFYKIVSRQNTLSCLIQEKYIKKTLYLVMHKCSQTFIDTMLKNQIENAIKWCHTYDIPINHKSYFVKYSHKNNKSI